MKSLIQKLTMAAAGFGLILSFAGAADAQPTVKRYTDEEYNKLKKAQYQAYWNDLQAELKKWQDAKADYDGKITTTQAEVDKLKADIKAVEAEIVKYQLVCIDQELKKLEAMNYDDLKANQSKIDELEAMLKEIKGYNGADSPENAAKIKEIEDRIAKVRESLTLPTTHTVVKGEYLYKIAGYPQIYNDPLKWPRIYRANRDLIKNPNLIYPGWVLKIPRGVVNSWTVYRGETLAKISGYEEVYSKPGLWTKIYEANRDQVKDPNMIYPKQVLTIPR